MKTSHTPGPWSAHGQAIYSGETYLAQCWDETSRELDCYADVIQDFPVPENEKEADANARLIAAAPELLEALQYLEKYPLAMQGEGFAKEVRALIAKATRPPSGDTQP